MFSQQLDELYESARLSIINNVAEKGVVSKTTNLIVIPIEENGLNFNLDNGRYLVEVGQHVLIDDGGYQHSFGVLPYEELCYLADFINDFE